MQAKKSVIDQKLAELGREAEEREAQRRALTHRLPYLDIKTAPINLEALSLVPEDQALKAKMAVIAKKSQGKELALAIFDPAEPEVKRIASGLEAQGYKTSPNVVSMSSLQHIWSFYRFITKEAHEITGAVAIEEKKIVELTNRLTSLSALEKSLAPINKKEADTSELLEIILAGALSNRASDIHLEPEEHGIKLRLRIDGALYDAFKNMDSAVYAYLLSRVKLLAGLKLNIHDEPQDGRFSIRLPKTEIEARVAVAPAEYGEVIVMRLLDPATLGLSLTELGLRQDDLAIIENELKKPNGMILNTGPTGSGKTTTLYAFLQYKKKPELKIITIEDPIEYQLAGVEQTQVDEKGGYTFANGLKSIMRQDPDIILVGEMRDKETAEIGIQSALTGHLVFSTVHANEAAGAVPRLLDLGVRASSIGPAINLVIGQRLVRRLCEHCKAAEKVSDELKKNVKKLLDGLPSRVDKNEFKEVKIYKSKGCDKCNGLGYKGRIAVYELLIVGPEMEELIDKETNEANLQKYAVGHGMVTMQQDGILKVVFGITTFEEVEDVTGPVSW